MAKVKSIKAEYGASLEVKGTWHKFLFGIELDLEEGDNSDKIKEMAWNTCYNEIHKQIQEVISD